jgi:hypothetical protein
MIEVARLEFVIDDRSIGIILLCLCAFLFQTFNAAMSYYFTPVKTVINSNSNISEAREIIN